MTRIDPIIEILIEWALTEFTELRNWNTLRFVALIFGGIYRY